MTKKDNLDAANELGEDAEKERTLEETGSAEFSREKKETEEVDIPYLRGGIKAERVDKGEIYGSREEKQDAFIANLGRRERENERKAGELEYAKAGVAGGRRAVISAIILIIISSLVGGGYWFWFKKKQEEELSEIQARSISELYEESVKKETALEKTEPEKEQAEEINPAEITLSVLNEGAQAGSAGKTKDLLAEKGYAKATAGNGEADSAGNSIYYTEEKFKPAAEAIKEILAEEKTEAEVKEASTSEQRSADVVVILGK